MSEKGMAVLKYDFDANMWVAVLESNPIQTGCGDTPDEAVASLKYQCNKHELWGTR